MSSTAESAVGSGHGEAVTTSAIVAEAVTGSHVLQIKGYSLTKGLGIGKFIKSSTFCVCGHRWYIRYYPDGDCLDSADWISIYLQHDHTDAVDVKARFKFSVLDDIGEPVPTFSQKSCMRTFSSSKGGSWGFNKFVARKALEESSSYLKDDCLKVRCDVTVSKEISTEATTTTQCVMVPPSNMHLHFGCLLSGAVGADVTFDVAGEMFAAHRCVLKTVLFCCTPSTSNYKSFQEYWRVTNYLKFDQIYMVR
jgi:speckle-type POZ protein